MRLPLERAHHGRRMGGGGRGSFLRSLLPVLALPGSGTLHPHHCAHCPQTRGVCLLPGSWGPGTLLECEFLIVPRVEASLQRKTWLGGEAGGVMEEGRPGPSPQQETGGTAEWDAAPAQVLPGEREASVRHGGLPPSPAVDPWWGWDGRKVEWRRGVSHPGAEGHMGELS